MEDVEAQRCNHRVAHRVLLVEVSRIGARLYIEPCAPLVKQEIHLLFRIIFVHDRDMLHDYRLDLDRLAESIVVFLFVELGCRTLAAVPSLYGIVVQRNAVHPASDVLHQDFSPVIVIVRRAAGNLVKPVSAVVAAIGLVAVIQM